MNSSGTEHNSSRITDQEFQEHARRHYLNALRTAIQHESARVGKPAHPGGEITLDYARLSTEQARPVINDMLENGLAPERLYAAIVLDAIDREEGRRALERITPDRSPVLVPFGNILMPRPAGDLASALLAGRQMCFIPPFNPGKT